MPYGHGSVSLALPEDVEVVLLEPRDKPGLDDISSIKATDEALTNLGDRFQRPDSLQSEGRVAVAINDKTRPVPHHILIPSLLRSLESWGWPRSEVLFIIAVGAHAPMTPEEYPLILPGGIAEGCRIVSHDSDDDASLVYLGTTESGTPCRVSRLFAEANLRIVVGNIEPHQFVGWSGGVKSAAVGLTSRETIAANHSMMAVEGAGPCLYKDNPVRQDIEELGRMIGVDLALNVVMNRRKEIVSVLAGDPVDVMHDGIEVGMDLFAAPFREPADIVIVSPGGHPKDINLYQAQKSLRHGSRAARPGAPIILVAACSDGVGSHLYEKWMEGKFTHEEVKEAFESEDFLLGHHKGMLFAADSIGREVFLVSELPAETVSRLLLKPVETLDIAIRNVLSALDIANPKKNIASENEGKIRVAILPYGNATVPIKEEE